MTIQQRRLKIANWKHAWVFKAAWRGTALKIIVEGQNLTQATKRAEGRILRMEGGIMCLELKPLYQLY